MSVFPSVGYYVLSWGNDAVRLIEVKNRLNLDTFRLN